MKNYSLSLDILRIISAFFVVFSHATDIFVLDYPVKSSFSYAFIYYLNTLSRVAVPLFIILSGYLVLDENKTKNLAEFYKKRFSRVFTPLIFWVPIYFWWTNFWGHIAITKEFISRLIWTGDLWHLYFLVIIIELYLISPFIAKYMLGNRKKESLWFLFFSVFSIFCAMLILLPHHIDLRNNIITMFIPYIGVFYAGAFFRNFRVSKVQIIELFLLYIILGILTNIIAKGDTNSFIVHNYGPTLLFMTYSFFLAFKNIENYIPKKFVTGLSKYVAPFAMLTFGIYIIHYAVLEVIREYLHLYPWQIHSPIIFYAALPAVITFAICAVAIFILRKIPYSKWIIG